MRQLNRSVSQLLLFIYWTIVIALLMSHSSAIAIITIYLLDNSYSSFRTLLLYICGASAAAIYFHATKPLIINNWTIKV
ncbi:MAG: hypothetical protein SWX82_01775 [Cyanobacteriota bacterium]|nr:hypothetical protein [Cyanobacteriota bacterium]